MPGPILQGRIEVARLARVDPVEFARVHAADPGLPAVVTEVEGSAFRTGRADFELDPADPLGEGFLLR